MAGDVEYFIQEHGLKDVTLLGHSMYVAIFALRLPQKLDSKTHTKSIAVVERQGRGLTVQFLWSSQDAQSCDALIEVIFKGFFFFLGPLANMVSGEQKLQWQYHSNDPILFETSLPWTMLPLKQC